MKVFVLIAFPVLLLLNIFDAYSTILLLQHGAEEINPYMLWLMDLFGVAPAMLLAKGVFLLILLWVCYQVIIKPDITQREKITVSTGFIIMISYYGYFMYTCNFQLLLML